MGRFTACNRAWLFGFPKISVMEEKHREKVRTVNALKEQPETERKYREQQAVKQEQKKQQLIDHGVALGTGAPK
jgi:hypothetical protein